MRALRTLQVAVKRGHELLVREIGPDYYKQIDLDRLDIEDCQRCVLGQLGGYLDTIERIGLSHNQEAQSQRGFEASPLGRFSEFGPGRDDTYRVLTNIWRRRLKKLQDAN
jgi:hypothetical protein